MPNHLSILGIIHTAISVIALFFAFFALLRYGKLDQQNGPGKLYIVLTVVACLTSLPIMKTGHPTGGHGLAIIILLLLPIGIYASSIKLFGKAADYIKVIAMSTTLFFSFIPATVETLTRLPIAHPLADGPAAPIVKTGLLVLVVLYLTGVTYQLVKIKSRKRSAKTTDGSMKLS